MSLLVLSTSLSPKSKSRLLARHALATLEADGVACRWLDLQELPLPFCDGGAAYGHPNAAEAGRIIAAAQGIIVAAPVYNYDLNAGFKNLVELTGKAAWENKTVAFLNAAGGASSYMSVMAAANSLMLDFRCVIVPRFVYATPGDFENGRIANPEVEIRVVQCARATAELTRQRSS